MFDIRTLAAAALLAAGIGSCAQAASLTHLWTLDGTDADSVGATPITLNEPGLTATGFFFGSNAGLSAHGAMPTASYTIDLSFDFDNVTGYNKVVDFKDKTSDTGLYVYNGKMNFYNVVTGTASIVADQAFRLTITRDGATDQFSAYVNGVLDLTFADTSGLAEFTGADAVADFFQDDSHTNGREHDSGFVDYIRVWDGALSANEVAALGYPTTTPAVPLPAAGWLLVAGLGAIGALRRR